jgi:hypothetical protein
MAAPFADASQWLDILFATSALIYRVSWLLIYRPITYPPPTPIFSILTKFIFALSGLWCFTRLFTMHFAPRCPDRRTLTNDFMHLTATAVCMTVTSINYGSSWIWASGALDRALTHGVFLDDPSRFDRVVAVLAQSFLGVGLLSLAVYQWKMVGSRLWLAWMVLQHWDSGLKSGNAEKPNQASLPLVAEKVLLDSSDA